MNSTELILSPSDIKIELAKIGLTQDRAARLIHKSPAMVSMVLAGKAISEPVLQRLSRLIAKRRGR